jgi:hypothetical protein
MATGVAGTLASPEPAGRNKILTLVIAHRHEIAGAGIEALLQASGHVMALTVTLTGTTVTLDETAGLQNDRSPGALRKSLDTPPTGPW